MKAAGLVETLEGKGPFTVFAPTNAAFGKLPAGTVDNLVKPENKATLTKILTYHVVPGRLEASDLTDGKMLKTVEGEELTVKKADGKIWIVDAKGGSSMVTISNVHQSNGVIHVDRHRADAGVVMPRVLSSLAASIRKCADRFPRDRRGALRGDHARQVEAIPTGRATASRGNPARFFVNAIDRRHRFHSRAGSNETEPVPAYNSP